MKRPLNYLLIIFLIVAAFAAYFVSNRLGCWKTNYELRHSKVTITTSDSIRFFTQFIHKDGEKPYRLSLIELGGRGCKPCRRMDSVLVDIRKYYKDRLHVKKNACHR